MSSAAARTRARRSDAARRRPSRATARRRRRTGLLALAAVLGVGAAIGIAALGPLDDAVREITLPLRHDDIIRQQAADKHLDPALVAGVIYEESRFSDQTSHAGARGLMQITPDTADFIAHRSGGTAFVQEDLADPQINIAYGTFYLRYLLDRYDGDEALAIAAYNAGHGNVDKWLAEHGGSLDVDDIPFPETRAYVDNVLERRGEYREHYAADLGL